MGGIELPWDYDPDLKIENKPSELFPVSEKASEQLREADSSPPSLSPVAYHAHSRQDKRDKSPWRNLANMTTLLRNRCFGHRS